MFSLNRSSKVNAALPSWDSGRHTVQVRCRAVLGAHRPELLPAVSRAVGRYRLAFSLRGDEPVRCCLDLFLSLRAEYSVYCLVQGDSRREEHQYSESYQLAHDLFLQKSCESGDEVEDDCGGYGDYHRPHHRALPEVSGNPFGPFPHLLRRAGALDVPDSDVFPVGFLDGLQAADLASMYFLSPGGTGNLASSGSWGMMSSGSDHWRADTSPGPSPFLAFRGPVSRIP